MNNVENMTSSRGNAVPNQFIISELGRGANGNFIKKETFQSYKSTIAVRIVWNHTTDIILDENYWDYSVTTGKYRNQFLHESKSETMKKIKEGIYKLSNLNNN